jgi:hypothetical protein
MATFIKNFCSTCPPTACEAPPVCDGCCIAPSQLFLAPGSEPQEGMIIVNRFIINMSGVTLCPCEDNPDPLEPFPCGPIYAGWQNPIILEYNPINFPNYDRISGFPYFCINGGDLYFPINEPFSVLGLVGADGFPCYGPEFFRGDCVTSETETSITVRNSLGLESCSPFPYSYPTGYGGSVTITWE